MELTKYRTDMDERYHPEHRMVGKLSSTPGYHTRIPEGSPVHETRESMDYALTLLQSGDPARIERACDVMDRICELQVTDSTAQHYGIWGWFMEEPPQQMNPADWNWADFIGARLAQALVCHGKQLRPTTLKAATEALHHAAMSIFRRNMGPGYTNIAVMGAVVSAAAGEFLNQPLLLDYSRTRLANLLQLVESIGGFCEYNSPTYTRVVMEETERGLHMVRDAQFRELAEKVRVIAWKTIAEHFHPATGQIAGPCSRAYSERLLPAMATYLQTNTGASIVGALPGADANVVPAIACPDELKPRFAHLPADPYVTTHRFGANAHGDTIGTTWFTQQACLGTINRDIAWVQRRPVLGYWVGSDGQPVVLRARILKDGHDLAASYNWNAQRNGAVLSAWTFCYDVGDKHPVFDRNPDSVFPARDLLVRVSIDSLGGSVKTIDDKRFVLHNGDWQAIVTPFLQSDLNGAPVKWTCGSDGNDRYVQAVIFTGEDRSIRCREDRLNIALAIQLCPCGAKAPESQITRAVIDQKTHWQWGELKLEVPSRPIQFMW